MEQIAWNMWNIIREDEWENWLNFLQRHIQILKENYMSIYVNGELNVREKLQIEISTREYVIDTLTDLQEIYRCEPNSHFLLQQIAHLGFLIVKFTDLNTRDKEELNMYEDIHVE